MPTRRMLLTSSLFTLAACAAPGGLPFAGTAAPARTLTPYRGEGEFRQALGRWQTEARKLQGERRRGEGTLGGLLQQMAPSAAAPSAMAGAVAGAMAEQSAAKSADAAAEPITNVQTAGVDEGGIVKRAGDHLVILRRGRLFTVRVGGDTLQPAAVVDAFAPGSNPQGAWYDELLVAGSTVVVIGYSYARGGTEIGLFELGGDGALAYRATYHLRSFDYYSSRNYASRLIGRKLVFYTPTLLQPWSSAPWEQLPALRHWQGEAAPGGFQRILPATRIYRSGDDFDPREPLALHTVTACDLDSPTLRCESTAVLGPAGRVFYVSAGSVYVWTSSPRRGGTDGPVRAAVFRVPLDGAAPSAVRTTGVPIDQMSFLEEAEHLNVLLREAGPGEGMWGSERSRGAMALLRLPLAAFGDGLSAAPREHYRELPAPAGGAVHNRFVGDWLLWGGSAPGAWAIRPADRAEPQALAAEHGIERIEAMGAHAVLVGNLGADLHFSSVRLTRQGAALAGRHVQTGASQGETRSHGFFFRPTGADEGLLGLPVLEPGRRTRQGGVFGGAQGSAAVLFLRQHELAFSALGRLEARPGAARDDACRASCVDWYGNARPIFLGERVFALLGYELVEGRLAGGWRERIEERRRISFAPTRDWGRTAD